MPSDIIDLGAAELARRIARRELTSSEVVEAFIGQIDETAGQLNAVVVRLFDEARAAAKTADEVVRRGDPLGPLHGVPMTIKECFHVAGTPSTMGLTNRLENIRQDGIMVRRLKRAGAIVLGKTNVPQLMVWHEADNPLYGRTNNPWDLTRGPGGSTGGEAAIIAARGSPLGLGGDLGGSIRIPCHACGIHGLKPTCGRLPRGGTAKNLHGMEAIKYQPGPLARRVEDLQLALVALSDAGGEPEPAEVPPVPLGDPGKVDVARLRIAMFTDDGYFPASPAIRRAVNDAAAALCQLGAVVETWTPPNTTEAMNLYFGLMGADGGADARHIVKGSRIDWRLRRLLRIAGLPDVARDPLAAFLRAVGQRRTADLLSAARGSSARRYWQLTERLGSYIQEYLDSLTAGRFDAVLSPPHALPAMPHETALDLLPAASYSFVPNLLGVPVGVVSTTRVRPGEETDRPPSRDKVERLARQAETGSAGLPVGVQVLGRPWREDVVLAIMGAIESSFATRDDFPPNMTSLTRT